MHVNQPRGGDAEATTPTLAVGDQVSYVALAGGGREYRLEARTGVIEEIDGNVATLRAEDGRSITYPLNALASYGQAAALARLITRGQG